MTDIAAQILDYLQAFHAEHGYMPSYEEIAEGVSLASKSGIARPLMELERMGKITQARSKAGVALPRGIVLND